MLSKDRIPQQPPAIASVGTSVERPLWSVMIPAYNCIDYLTKTIKSVLLQDLGAINMQIQVVDDCSTDGNIKVLVESIGKGRVGYFRQPYNVGSLRNFETCINLAKGQYVHILHGDDFVLDGFYKELTTLFDRFPEAGAAFSNYYYVNHKDDIINIKNEHLLKQPGIISDFLSKIASKQLVQPPAMVVKRSTYEKLGSFFGAHFGEDWEMWVRIAAQYPVAFTPRYLAAYRVAHGIGISYDSFLSGQNIEDINCIINIIQNHIPHNKKKRLKKEAKSYYSVYSIRIANSLLYENREAAMRQVSGALKMSRSFKTLFWASRFYLMDIVNYKKIEKKFLSK